MTPGDASPSVNRPPIVIELLCSREPHIRIDRIRIASIRRAQRELWHAITLNRDAIERTRKLLTEIETHMIPRL